MNTQLNPTLDLLHNRKSVRAYEDKAVSREVRDQVLAAAMRAPTAGNMQLYSIIEITDQTIKNTLVETCDNQPFIARAPFVLLFLADYQRWYDYFLASGVEDSCSEMGVSMRKPQEGDLFLACCDALIAAQTAVVAAESLGLGSCYIGDIMENYEIHRDLFDLPSYVFPISLLCIGYPTQGQKDREQTSRFDSKFIAFENKYQRFAADDLRAMFACRHAEMFKDREEIEGAHNVGQRMYWRKFDSDFSREMSRSARAMLKAWLGG
jgi:FMN reductase (NADPH)/FMN reductase [NAD(P)H]